MITNPATHDPGIDAGPPWEVIEPAAAEQAPGPAQGTSLAVFDPIEQTLAQIEARHKNVVYDLATSKGNDAARKARKELVTVRAAADEVYKTWNQPILAAQEQARALRDGFKARVQLLEKPLDEAIKADEERRAAEKKARDDAEAARVKAIRDRIAAVYALPANVAGAPSAKIDAATFELTVLTSPPEFFEELLGEAQAAADVVRTKLEAMMSAAKAAEDRAEAQRLEAERLAAERAELDRQRAEIAAQQEAARVAAKRAEADRLAAIALQDEERRVLSERMQAEERQRAQAASKAEADRLATIAEAQRLADETRAAAEREAQDRLAEQQRQLDAERAAFEAEQAAARKAKQEADDAELEHKLAEAQADDRRKADLANAEMRAAMDAMPVAPALVRIEKPGLNGSTLVTYVRQAAAEAPAPAAEHAAKELPAEEPAKPELKAQDDAFEIERQAESARAAAAPKPPAKRPADDRLTAVVARAFDVEPVIAAEWLGTYDAFEEIARLQGVPA